MNFCKKPFTKNNIIHFLPISKDHFIKILPIEEIEAYQKRFNDLKGNCPICAKT